MRKNFINARLTEFEMKRNKLISKVRYEIEQSAIWADGLAEHPRAQMGVALRKVQEYGYKLRMSKWVTYGIVDRKIILSADQDVLAEEAKLDGCYVLKTDIFICIPKAINPVKKNYFNG